MPHRAAVLIKLLQVASGFLITNPIDDAYCDQVEPGGCRYLEACVVDRIRPHTPRCRVDSTRLLDIVTELDDNPKLDAATDLLDQVLADADHKIIVWCVFDRELDMVATRLTDRGWGHVRVDGDNSHRAQELIDQFSDDPLLRVYLAQVATGVGVTINAATYMLFYSLPFSLTTYHQALDRNYRIGQDHKVTVYRLIGTGTPETAIAKLLDVKVDVDDVLTRRIDCMTCERNVACIAARISPFDPGCVYQKSIERPVTRTRVFGDVGPPNSEE
jgi:SNF2 family DNA or RNA helicase